MVSYRGLLTMVMIQNLKCTVDNVLSKSNSVIFIQAILMVYELSSLKFFDFINFDQEILYTSKE